MANPNSAYVPMDNTLKQLMELDAGSKKSGLKYSGDVTPEAAKTLLQDNQGLIIDVRTPSEWRAGVPDVAENRLAKVSWKLETDYSLNPHFTEQMAQVPGISKDIPLLFLCRSGGRSTNAAEAMTAVGYRYCFNISGGFESDKGWKAQKLPCKQG